MTKAVTLANLASGEALTIDETNDRIGIASTAPSASVDVNQSILLDGNSGVVTATSFVGDGSSLTGVANTDFVVSIATTTSRLTVNSDATVSGVTTAGGVILKDGNIVAAGATLSGVLTYEDVTNIDSVGVVTARVGLKVLAGGINAVGVITGTSFKGDGSALTGIAATDTIAAASLTVSGISTLSNTQLGIGKSLNFGNTQKAFIQGHSVGVGSTTTAGRDAGIGTAIGTIIFDSTTGFAQVYNGNGWDNMSNKFAATGGTESEAGGYTYHLFESPGTFTVDSGTRTCEVFVVGGGGAGGTTNDGLGNARSGAGGGGGAAVGPVGALSSGDYTIVVGAGGAVNYPGWPAGATGGSGGTSSFAPGQPYAISATGGGGGTNNRTGGAGGTGSGGTTNGTGGAGNPNDNDPQDSGNVFGVTGGAGTNAAGGGGGGGDGNAGNGNDGGTGGAGTQNMFGPFGCGGGGGGAIDHGGPPVPAPFQGPGGEGYFDGGAGGGMGLTAGDGGGPVGGEKGTVSPTHTRNNRGGGGGTYGGGGGANMDNENAGGPATGGQGAGGVVIVRYLTP